MRGKNAIVATATSQEGFEHHNARQRSNWQS
jgi:hypothetical protein